MELHRLTKDDPRLDIDMCAFLGRTYSLKAIADYETGPGSGVSPEMAHNHPRDRPSALAYELRAQDKALDRVVTAVDLLVVVREPDRLDDRALLQGLVCPFYL